ncbi:MAG: hypothetical protein AAGF81_20085 [Pseudomonadota bacterium]
MKRSAEKPLIAAGLMALVGLCVQLNLPGWAYGGLAGAAGVVVAGWFALEKRVSAWLPDSEFPIWLMHQMS